MEQHPAIADTFHTFMASRHQSGPVTNWMSWFPAQQQVVHGAKADPTAVTIVDIGGGRGANVFSFLAKHPHAPGRFVIQDLDQVADRASQQGRAERMVYDFFTPQPIKGEFPTPESQITTIALNTLSLSRSASLLPGQRAPQLGRREQSSHSQEHGLGYGEGVFQVVYKRVDPSRRWLPASGSGDGYPDDD